MAGFRCQPRKWIWGLVPLILPFIGAFVLNTPILVKKLKNQANAQLAAADLDEARVEMDGRDARVTGIAHSKDALAKFADNLVRNRGVRRVDVSSVKIVKPVVLEVPTVNKYAGNQRSPQISGTWQEGVARLLSVKIAGKTYELGKSTALASDGKGNWTLKLPEALKDGVYDVAVSISDGKRSRAKDTGTDEIVIDTKGPKAAEVLTKVTTNDAKPVIEGRFDLKDTQSLVVKLAGATYELGKNKALTSPKPDVWSLKPSEPLKDGVFDVEVLAADSFGNETRTVAKGVVTIDRSPPAGATINAYAGRDVMPVLTGTWPDEPGNGLTVKIGQHVYTMGRGDALNASGDGKWTLNTDKPIDEGTYGVALTTTDSLGNARTVTVPKAVIVDRTPPRAPTVTEAGDLTKAPVLKGTFEEEAGNALRVVIAGRVFVLGRDRQLSSDGKGNWILRLDRPLVDGKHAVLVETADKSGNLARTDKPFIVEVDTKKPDQAVINPIISGKNPPVISGTWPRTNSNSLKVSVNGRDFTLGKDKELTSDDKGNWTLSLSAPLKEGPQAISVTVVDGAGNTSVAKSNDTDRAVVVDTTPPPAPTVATVRSRQRQPTITGSFKASETRLLVVSLAGQTYRSDKVGEVMLNGDLWSLKPRKPLRDGTYNVLATATDPAGNTQQDQGTDELVIDATAPRTPDVNPVFGTNPRPTVTGTWENDGENTLSVTLDGRTYTLKGEDGLSSDGDKWTLKPGEDLKVGRYDVRVQVADRMGNIAVDKTKGEVWVKTREAEQKKPSNGDTVAKTNTPAKADVAKKAGHSKAANACQAAFLETLAGEKIQFDLGKASIKPESKGLLNKLAAAAKLCPEARIEISGHTDSSGNAASNKSLSEARAVAVVDALVSRGIARKRLIAVGYGAEKPIGDNATEEGRRKNRRTEFKVINQKGGAQ